MELNMSMRSLISPVQLAKQDSMAGTVFYKQLFSYGTWINPNWWFDDVLTMELDRELAEQMVENFNNNTLGSKVAVPLNHTGDVTANTGEVVKLEAGDDGLYGYLEIKRPEVVADINNGLIFDVSVGFDWDYVSQKDGTHHGPTLVHVALVTEPYINNMTGFVEAELAKRHKEYSNNLTVGGKASVIMMSKAKVEQLKKEHKRMDLSTIKNEREFPVEVTYKDAEGNERTTTVEAGSSIDVPEGEAENVTKAITDAEAPAAEENQETEEEKKAREAQEDADRKAAEQKVADAENGNAKDEELSRARKEIAELKATQAYDTLLSAGKITPAQKDKFMALAKSDAMVELAKDQKVGIVELMSDILKAAPTLKMNEQGGASDDGKATLSKEDEKKLAKLGVTPEQYAKQVAAGKIKPIKED